MTKEITENGIRFIKPVISGRVAGVYKVTFDNDKFYIGSSCHLRKRFYFYKHYINDCRKNSKALQNAYKKCSLIEIEVIEYTYDIINLKKVETFYILNADCSKILNRAKTGISNKGIKWTKEEILNISNGLIGIKRSAETKIKMSVSKSNPIFSKKRWLISSLNAKRLHEMNAPKYKINHFSKEGILLATYKNLNHATLLTGMSECSISTKLNNGSKVLSNGNYFERADKDQYIGIYSETKIPKKKLIIKKEFMRRGDIDIDKVISLVKDGHSINKIAGIMKTYPNTLKYKIKIKNSEMYNKIFVDKVFYHNA